MTSRLGRVRKGVLLHAVRTLSAVAVVRVRTPRKDAALRTLRGWCEGAKANGAGTPFLTYH